MTRPGSGTVLALSEGALLVEFPELSDADANAAAISTAAALDREGPAGILDAIPGARTVVVLFDPGRLEPGLAARRLAHASGAGTQARATGKLVRFPVAYGGESGPDLAVLAAERGLPAEEVARRHAAAEYRVAFLGFAPGFAYLTGLPAELQVPRLATPRVRVDPGTVAIAASYSGIYPGGTPGGWRLIGKTRARLFEEDADPPALLAPGDTVRFEPVAGESAPPAQTPTRRSDRRPDARPLLRVIRPGAFTSVQGSPGFGRARFGVPPGGAMDRDALADGNSLLGNSDGTPALELTLSGPLLEFLAPAVVCVSGADVAALRNDVPMSLREQKSVSPGDRLDLARISAGTRAYLCLAGGVVPAGHLGITRRLESGDRLVGSDGRAQVSRRRGSAIAPPAAGKPPPVFCVVLDPRAAGWFDAAALDAFARTSWRVSAMSDRRGVRLEGEPLGGISGPELPPEGTELGSIQVPGDGLPIVLGPDRPITGGYRKLGTVARADWTRFARLEPGQPARFRVLTLEEALAARGSIPWQ